MVTEVQVTLDAVEPMELLRHATPAGVWLRLDADVGPGGGWPVVAVRGDADAIRAFVADHWGEDAELDLAVAGEFGAARSAA